MFGLRLILILSEATAIVTKVIEAIKIPVITVINTEV